VKKGILELQGVVCGYLRGFTLKGVSLRLERGTVLGVIGPNGSGKTTLVRAISRILKPSGGRIAFEGNDIWELPAGEFAKRVAVVSQDSPSVDMRVEEYVMLGRLPHYQRFQFFESREDREKVAMAMELVGIGNLKERHLEETSGGERQLVGIAKAIAQEPRLLVLDEPVAHLDISRQLDVLNLVERLRGELGITVVMVLHDVNLAAEFCDVVGVMREGELLALGTPCETITEVMVREVYGVKVVVEKNRFSQRPMVVITREGVDPSC